MDIQDLHESRHRTLSMTQANLFFSLFKIKKNLVLDVESCWEPQEQGVKSTTSSLPSVETEVIEPVGGRKRHTGVASNAETCTTQTQDLPQRISEVVKLTGLL